MTTLALSTGSLYSYGIARVFALAAETGFDAIEILADPRWDTRQADYVQRLSREHNLPIAAIHSPFISLHTPGWPADPLGRLRRSAALARAVGAPVVVTHLPLRLRIARVEILGGKSLLLPALFARQGEYGRFLREELPAFEAEHGVLVGVENMPAHRFLGLRLEINAMNNVEALARLSHLTLDTTHLGTWGADILAVYEQLRERIVHVHLSNFDGREHRLPPDGHLPLGELLRRMARDGYERAISVETGPEPLGAEEEPQVRERLRRVVAFCREHLDSPAPRAGL